MQTAIDYRDFIPNPGNWPSTSEQKKLVNLAREEIKKNKKYDSTYCSYKEIKERAKDNPFLGLLLLNAVPFHKETFQYLQEKGINTLKRREYSSATIFAKATFLPEKEFSMLFKKGLKFYQEEVSNHEKEILELETNLSKTEFNLDYEEALIHKSNALEQLSIMHKLIHHEQEAEIKAIQAVKILEKLGKYSWKIGGVSPEECHFQQAAGILEDVNVEGHISKRIRYLTKGGNYRGALELSKRTQEFNKKTKKNFKKSCTPIPTRFPRR